jgi:chemotaxis methyl-accepting protein methylase
VPISEEQGLRMERGMQVGLRGKNEGLGHNLKRGCRIIRNVFTRREASREYSEKLNKVIWNQLGTSRRSAKILRLYGKFLHRRARLHQKRTPEALYTRFLRNRPLLDLIATLASRKEVKGPMKICVLGCSKGSEIYSLISVIRRRRPDLEISASGVDISSFAIEEAKKGAYAQGSKELERLSAQELADLFIRDGDLFVVKDGIKRGISWIVSGAEHPDLVKLIGLQDIVLANNFLIHLSDLEADACLENIMRLVAPGGYLCLWNVDLELKMRYVRGSGLKPICENMEQIYQADETAVNAWPWVYWALEPLDKTKQDWMLRYPFVYQVPVSHPQTQISKTGLCSA